MKIEKSIHNITTETTQRQISRNAADLHVRKEEQETHKKKENSKNKEAQDYKSKNHKKKQIEKSIHKITTQTTQGQISRNAVDSRAGEEEQETQKRKIAK